MHDTGCRRGEVASMQATSEWLNLKEGTAMVTGKTGPRIVAFGPTAGAALYRYIRLRQRRAPRTETALWLGRKGRLQGNGIYQHSRARSTKRASPHRRRRTSFVSS
jgi:site-specific recombinase XerC